MTRDERGAGVVASVAGVGVFLGLLLFSAQVLFNLYAASVVTAATYDAARIVARGGDRARAEAHARNVLGEYATRVELTWQERDDVIVVRVQARTPPMMLPSVGGVAAFGDLDRTIRVRRECFRDDTGCRP